MKKDGNTDIYKEKDSYEGEDGNNTDVEIPEVYMKVTITDTETIKKESVNLKEQLNKYKNYSSVKENVKIGNNKYNATKYSIVKGTKWNSEVKDVYIININKSKDMMVEISYFVEASEGWGAKFNQLVIKTLEINQN